MPILDLADAKPLEGYKPRPRARALDAATLATALSGAGGLGGFHAGKVTRLNQDFIGRSRSADQDLFGDNIRLRARARDLAINSPHIRKFLQMCKQNVIGEHGILMKSKVTGVNGKGTTATDRINKRIEEEWKRWCKLGSCTADGKFTFTDLQHLAIANCAREGESIIKYVFGKQFNPTGFALQPLDNDQLDDTLMAATDNGGSIRMGVQVDKFRRPLFYHLWNGHPQDIFSTSRQRTPVPADQILHTAVWERPGQTRGYTWMAPAILPLNMFAGWEEATLVAARASAAKFGTIESNYPEGIDFGDEDEDGTDRNMDGTQVMTANSGELLNLEPGQHMNWTDPRFPMNTYKEFSQAALRSVASGLLVQYPSLANDLEGVNFSSIRAGLIDERDCWRLIQRWFIHHFMEPIRLRWLSIALLTTLQDINLSPAQMEQVSWMARGWDWVDPQKDADATILKLGQGLSTYEMECAKIGLDWQEITRQRKKEQDFQKEEGVQFGVDITGDQGGKGVAADAETDVDEEGQGTAAAAGGAGKSGKTGKKKGS